MLPFYLRNLNIPWILVPEKGLGTNSSEISKGNYTLLHLLGWGEGLYLDLPLSTNFIPTACPVSGSLEVSGSLLAKSIEPPSTTF
jgi:hypothetical protein